MSEASRPSSPLACAGPRTTLNVSRLTALKVSRAAAQFGVTQRLILEELLGDERVLSWAAREVARRIKPPGTAPERGPALKLTHQDAPGSTRGATSGQ